MNLAGTTRPTATSKIKRKIIDEEEVEEDKTEPHEMPNHSTRTYFPYADKEGKEDKTRDKIALICQETQVEEAAVQYNNTCCNNGQKKIITVNGNVK